MHDPRGENMPITKKELKRIINSLGKYEFTFTTDEGKKQKVRIFDSSSKECEFTFTTDKGKELKTIVKLEAQIPSFLDEFTFKEQGPKEYVFIGASVDMKQFDDSYIGSTRYWYFEKGGKGISRTITINQFCKVDSNEDKTLDELGISIFDNCPELKTSVEGFISKESKDLATTLNEKNSHTRNENSEQKSVLGWFKNRLSGLRTSPELMTKETLTKEMAETTVDSSAQHGNTSKTEAPVPQIASTLSKFASLWKQGPKGPLAQNTGNHEVDKKERTPNPNEWSLDKHI